MVKLNSHFQVLEKLSNPVHEGGVICLVETLLPITKNVSGIPVELLWKQKVWCARQELNL